MRVCAPARVSHCYAMNREGGGGLCLKGMLGGGGVGPKSLCTRNGPKQCDVH